MERQSRPMSSLAAAASRQRSSISSTTSSVPTCSFYAKGECRRGAACRFRHEMPLPEITTTTPSPQAKKDAPHCSFYARGDCRRGQACAFRHESSTTSSSTPKQQQQQKRRLSATKRQQVPEKRWFYGETGWYYGTCHPQPGEWQEHGMATSSVHHHHKSTTSSSTKPMSSLAAAAQKGKRDAAATSTKKRDESSSPMSRKQHSPKVVKSTISNEKPSNTDTGPNSTMKRSPVSNRNNVLSPKVGKSSLLSSSLSRSTDTGPNASVRKSPVSSKKVLSPKVQKSSLLSSSLSQSAVTEEKSTSMKSPVSSKKALSPKVQKSSSLSSSLSQSTDADEKVSMMKSPVSGMKVTSPKVAKSAVPSSKDETIQSPVSHKRDVVSPRAAESSMKSPVSSSISSPPICKSLLAKVAFYEEALSPNVTKSPVPSIRTTDKAKIKSPPHVAMSNSGKAATAAAASPSWLRNTTSPQSSLSERATAPIDKSTAHEVATHSPKTLKVDTQDSTEKNRRTLELPPLPLLDKPVEKTASSYEKQEEANEKKTPACENLDKPEKPASSSKTQKDSNAQQQAPVSRRGEQTTQEPGESSSPTESKLSSPTDSPVAVSKKKENSQNKNEVGTTLQVSGDFAAHGDDSGAVTSTIDDTAKTNTDSKKEMGILPSFAASLKIDTSDADIAISRTSTTEDDVAISHTSTEEVSPLGATESPSHGFRAETEEKHAENETDRVAVKTTPPPRSARNKANYSSPKMAVTTTKATPPSSSGMSSSSSLARAAAAGRRTKTPSSSKKSQPNNSGRGVPCWERLYQDGEKTKQKLKLMQTDAVDKECTFSPNLNLTTPRNMDGSAFESKNKNKKNSRTQSAGKNSSKGQRKPRGRNGSGVHRVIGGPSSSDSAKGRGNSRDLEESSVLSEHSESHGQRKGYGSTRRRAGSPSSSTANSRGGRRSLANQKSKPAGKKSGSPSSLSAAAARGKKSFHNNQSREYRSGNKKSDGASSVTSAPNARRPLPNEKCKVSDASGWARKVSMPSNGTSSFGQRQFSSSSPTKPASSARGVPLNKSKPVDQNNWGNNNNSPKEATSDDIYGKRSVKSLAARFEGTAGKGTRDTPGRGGRGIKEAGAATPQAQRPRGSLSTDAGGLISQEDAGSTRSGKKWVPPKRHRWGSDSDDDSY